MATIFLADSQYLEGLRAVAAMEQREGLKIEEIDLGTPALLL
jgi:hypothetical protein